MSNANPHLANPYNPDGREDWKDNHKITSRVAQDDYYFLKKRYPMLTGLTDKVVATLYKKFIDELRRIDSVTPIEPAWALTDPSYILIRGVLDACNFARVERSGTGNPDSGGDAGPQHVERGTSGIHQTLRGPSEQRTESQGKPTGEGEQRPVETKETKARPRRGSPRVTRGAKS